MKLGIIARDAAGLEELQRFFAGHTFATCLIGASDKLEGYAYLAQFMGTAGGLDLILNAAGAEAVAMHGRQATPMVTLLTEKPCSSEVAIYRRAGAGCCLVAARGVGDIDGLVVHELDGSGARDGMSGLVDFCHAAVQAREDYRPWGYYEVLSDDRPDHKVKRITVWPGKRLSLQLHHRRQEHWLMVAGRALVTVGEQQVELAAAAAIDIPRGAAHRIENIGPEPLVFIEVQQGDYFGEDDIVRLADDFGRS